jgi:hypothetical protein
LWSGGPSDRKIETGKWKLENRNWKIETGNWKMENGSLEMEIGWSREGLKSSGCQFLVSVF